jgi:hypothetical protein
MGSPRIRTPQGLPEKTPLGIPIPRDVPSGNDVRAFLRFRHANSNKYCISKCKKPELVVLMKFFKKVEERTWKQIYDTAGTGLGKTGLGYERVDASQLPNMPSGLSRDVQVFKLKVDDKFRVFAFRDEDNACNLLFFDPQKKLLS